MTPRWTAYFLHPKIGIYLKGNYIQPNIESSFPYTIVSRNCSFKIVSKIYFEFFCAISGAEKKIELLFQYLSNWKKYSIFLCPKCQQLFSWSTNNVSIKFTLVRSGAQRSAAQWVHCISKVHLKWIHKSFGGRTSKTPKSMLPHAAIIMPLGTFWRTSFGMWWIHRWFQNTHFIRRRAKKSINFEFINRQNIIGAIS